MSPTRSAGSSAVRAMPRRSAAPHTSSRVSRRLGGRQQQQQPRLFGEVLEPSQEALLDPARQRQRARQAEATRQLRRREPDRQFQQRQRVTPRLGQDLLADLHVHRPPHH